MKEELIKQLIEKTFAKVACPLQGNGLYSEIQKAIQEAFRIGEQKQLREEKSYALQQLQGE
jgi:hypothetical protein